MFGLNKKRSIGFTWRYTAYLFRKKVKNILRLKNALRLKKKFFSFLEFNMDKIFLKNNSYLLILKKWFFANNFFSRILLFCNLKKLKFIKKNYYVDSFFYKKKKNFFIFNFFQNFFKKGASLKSYSFFLDLYFYWKNINNGYLEYSIWKLWFLFRILFFCKPYRKYGKINYKVGTRLVSNYFTLFFQFLRNIFPAKKKNLFVYLSGELLSLWRVDNLKKTFLDFDLYVKNALISRTNIFKVPKSRWLYRKKGSKFTIKKQKFSRNYFVLIRRFVQLERYGMPGHQQLILHKKFFRFWLRKRLLKLSFFGKSLVFKKANVPFAFSHFSNYGTILNMFKFAWYSNKRASESIFIRLKRKLTPGKEFYVFRRKVFRILLFYVIRRRVKFYNMLKNERRVFAVFYRKLKEIKARRVVTRIRTIPKLFGLNPRYLYRKKKKLKNLFNPF
jgi:hypothetical protein